MSVFIPAGLRARKSLRLARPRLAYLLTGALLFVVLVGPLLIGHDPTAIDPANQFADPSAAHLFGTDNLGRDVLARLALGGRTTLAIAVGSVTIASAIAIPLALGVGYVGGLFDAVGTRIIDLFFAIPSLLLAIGIVGMLGRSMLTTMLALGLAYWPFYTRLIRGEVVSIRSRRYVDASRVLGAPGRYTILREIMPGLVPLMLVQIAVMLGFAVLDEAGLGFLGLGVQPPDPSWGSELANSRAYLVSHPAYGLLCGVPILLAVLSFNLLADVIRDAVAPGRVDS